MTKSYLGADGAAHVRPQGHHRKKSGPCSPWLELLRRNEAEEREMCLHCKRPDCVYGCPDLTALRKRQKQQRKELKEAMKNAEV